MLGSVAAPRPCTCRNDDANEAAPHEGNAAMKIVPTNIQQQIDRVDHQRSRAIGIGCGVLAAWCAFRLLWLFYIAMTFGAFFGTLVFEFVLWGVIGAIAAIAATAFLTRYAQRPRT
jgi:hypothetical protein